MDIYILCTRIFKCLDARLAVVVRISKTLDTKCQDKISSNCTYIYFTIINTRTLFTEIIQGLKLSTPKTFELCSSKRKKSIHRVILERIRYKLNRIFGKAKLDKYSSEVLVTPVR